MKLSKLIKRIEYRVIQGDPEADVLDIAYDSRRVGQGFVFVCLSGASSDGHDFIKAAVERGASAVVVSRETEYIDGITYIYTPDTREALAHMSCVYFGDPSNEIKLVGITGTKGKTTTAYMIKSLFERAGHKTGLIGTIETIVGDKREKSVNTTPESYELQKLLRRMADSGCEYADLEVSSQGLKMHRVTGTRFPLGIYTNLSRDHIGGNEHPDMEDYIASKSLFFRMCETALINADCQSWSDVLRGGTCKRLFYGENRGGAECGGMYICAEAIRNTRRGERLCVDFTARTETDAVNAACGLPGRHTVHNALAALGASSFFGQDITETAAALTDIRVPGRTQLAAEGLPFTVLIDYAHNELSMESLLRALREYEPKRLLCLFGCGGGRDRARRYAMGEMAGRYAGLSILTEDNPREEDVMAIIDDILVGMSRAGGAYEIVRDRRDAIIHMLDIAEEGDICAIIGKGHEDYQEIRGRRYPFCEADIVAEWAERVSR